MIMKATRQKTIAFRVTEDEYDLLMKRTEEMNLRTISDFLKYALAPFLIVIQKDNDGNNLVYYKRIRTKAMLGVGKSQLKLDLVKRGRPKKKVEEIEKEKAEVLTPAQTV